MIAEEINERLKATSAWLSYIGQIKRKMEKVEEMDDTRAKIHSVLFIGSTKERAVSIRRINTRWRGVDRAREITQNITSGEKVIASLTDEGFLREIQQYDPQLVQMIRDINIDSRELRLLIELKGILEGGDRASVIATLLDPNKFDYPSYERGLSLFKDKRLANDLLDSLSYIKRVEREGSGKIEFMKRFLTGMRYGVRTDGMPLTHSDYVNEIDGFLAGLRSKHYNEGELADSIKEANAIKHLIYYRSTIVFLQKLLGMIYRGMKEGKWEEFEEFYKGLETEESVLHRLGDDKTAAELKAEKKKVHEAPMLWEDKINEVIKYKKTPAAFEDVRKGAVRYLFKILGERTSGLNSEMAEKIDAALKELSRHIDKRVKGIRNGKRIAMNIIKLREKGLWKELGIIKKKLSEKEDGLYLHMQVFDKINGILKGQDITDIMQRMQTLVRSKKEWLLYAFDNISRTKGRLSKQEFSLLNSALFAVNTLEKIADKSLEIDAKAVNSVEFLIRDVLQQLTPILDDYIGKLIDIIKFLEDEGFVVKQASKPIFNNAARVMANG